MCMIGLRLHIAMDFNSFPGTLGVQGVTIVDPQQPA